MKTSPLLQVLGAALLAAISTFAAAQAYPSRPITVVVPFAAGGPTDTIARILGDRMARSHKAEIDKWGSLIKTAGIKSE